MTPEIPSRAEAWLRYFNDLGLSSFYLDRTVAGQRVSGPTAAASARALRGAPLEPGVPSPARARSWTKAAAPVSLPPLVQTASLFEASERIEGDTLEEIREFIGDCQRCKLSQHRIHIVFGSGNRKADLVFVGEGPGHDEDVQGLPFVGRAGKLLTQMIEAMGLRREDVYICNVVKCRPPQNRAPEPDEVETCSPFLYRQIAVIRPKAIVCLGAVAFQCLLGSKQSISRLRGQWLDFRGTPLLATYHPAYLLRNPNAKAEVWEDLKKVMAHLGLTLPKRR